MEALEEVPDSQILLRRRYQHHKNEPGVQIFLGEPVASYNCYDEANEDL